jgi:hypothetical protein
MSDEDPTTRELRLEQMQREVRERERAREAEEDTEERQHARRAERASYLREQLEKRAESEERVQDDP